MTDVDRMSVKFASMSAEKAAAPPPVRGATINGGGAAAAHWADTAALGGHALAASAAPLKPHAQAKLLSPTEKCKVCNEAAAKHVHYGAMTCFSCRAFFRRSIQNKTAASYACRRNRSCEINIKTRKNCQFCRYQRCITVGMKPTWVLSEEERQRRFRKHREKQAAAAGDGGGRARSSDSLQEEDYADQQHIFAGYLPPQPGSSSLQGNDGEDEDDDQEEEEEVVESKVGLHQLAASSSAALYTLSQEAAKAVARPKIQLSHIRSAQSVSQAMRVETSHHLQSPDNFLSAEMIKNEPRCSPVSPPVYEMSQIPGMKQEPQTQILRTVSSALQQSFNPVYTHHHGFISQKVYLGSMPSSQGASVIVQPQQQTVRNLPQGLSSQRVTARVEGFDSPPRVMPDRQNPGVSAIGTDMDFRQLVDLIQADAGSGPATTGSLVESLEMAIGDSRGSASSSPRNLLYPNASVAAPLSRRVGGSALPPGLSGVLTGSSSVTRVSPVLGVAATASNGMLSTASSSPERFGDECSVYSGRGGGSDSGGGAEAVFSVNDFVETFMEGQEEESRSSGHEYPDDVYTSSDEEEYEKTRHLPIIQLTPEEERHLSILVDNFTERYKSVNFGEELIKEMIMCSMFGIPVSTSAAINGYRLSVERMTRVANSMPSFQSLSKADQTALLKENADLLVSMRGAIFFDTRKKGVDQIMISMGCEDMHTIHTTFAQLLKQDSMKHIDYKTFNSIQAVGQSNTEDRYNYLQEKVGKMLFDDTINIILTFVILFSADFCVLQEYDKIVQIQDEFTRLLHRYIFANYPRSRAVQYFANSIQVITWIREMADIKKQRAINASVRLP